jgi:hypothetical protein
MKLCGKIVRTVELQNRPCVCELGHAGGCNPFSPNPNMTGVKPPKVAENYIWKDGKIRCPWHGPDGCCIYIIGHYPEIPHKEHIE